jgi:tetratricopeptide (TPR) repeat protein
MRFKALLIALMLALFSVLAIASTDQEVWTSANDAYDNGDFATAIDDYVSLLAKGKRTPEIYYNLGNAYFKTDQIGLAIAAYHHSLKIDPAFHLAAENLDYVRQFVVDKVEEKPRGFILNIWYGLESLLSPQGNFIFTIVVFWCLALILSGLILGIGKKEFLTYLLILFAIMFILGIAITYSVVDRDLNSKLGVLTATSADLREGPGEEFGKIFTGHEGLEFKIITLRQDYYLVELKNGLKGWIKSSLLTEI